VNVQRIVIAVDFTPGVSRITAWVLRNLFPGTEPIFVHAIPPHEEDVRPRGAAAIETAALGAKVRIQELAEWLGIDSPRWSIQQGDAATVISDAVQEWGAQLIVVGPHEHTRWEWLGVNTVEDIVHRTRLPVLVVQGWPSSALAHATVAVEHLDRIPRNVSAWMQWLYSRFHTRFHAIHSVSAAIPVSTLAASVVAESGGEHTGAGTTSVEIGEAAADALAACGIPRDAVELDSDWGDPVHAVIAAAERDRSDLILVGESHHGRVARVLHGNVTRSIIEGAQRPVLVVPTDEPGIATLHR